MEKKYFFLIVWLWMAVLAAQAQVSLTTFNPYTQNFDGLNNRTGNFVSNSTLAGVYIEYSQFPGGTFPCNGNDGSTTVANFYHFGTPGSSDRALGGVASAAISGTGYVGIRFKNNTGFTIKNLEVSFAMEQWYNSGRQDQAKVLFDYCVSTSAIGSLNLATNTWQNIPVLTVDAPSTATVIENKNGNSSANRRTRVYTIPDVNVAAGSEVALRWRYDISNASNGNGLSIDDVTVTPETNVFYYGGSGNLNTRTNWFVNANGTGANPANFTANNQTFYVLQQVTDDRLGQNWTVSGTNSRIVVGNGINPAYLLVLGGGGNGINGTIDVLNGATLDIQRTGNAVPTLGRIGTTSTVKYVRDNNLTLGAQSFGNLVLDGDGVKSLLGPTVINGNLSLNGNSILRLTTHDLTVIRGGQVTGGSATAFVRADEGGALRQTVQANNQLVEFAVGLGQAGNASYNPVRIKQSAARSEDVFAVQVINGLYPRYSGITGVGTAVANRNVQRTWFISEENAGNANATVQLQWDNAHTTSNFDPSQARLEHYSTTANDWEAGAPVAAAEATGTVRTITRAGITSFSPFGVSSRPGGVLPVTLAAFTATRTPQAVRCDWKTASELNNDYFSVERSADGREFTSIGTVAGRGTTAQATTYSYLDQQPLNGLAYYRLRQTDLDGTTHYSPIVAVAGCATCADALQTLTLAPNPGTGLFRVLDANGQPASVTGTVLNTLGKVVQQLNSQSTVDLQAQPAGIYLLKLAAAHGAKVLRVVKQ